MFNQPKKSGAQSEIVVDLGSIGHNYRHVIRPMLNSDTKIIAMVKSNAYGHGLIEVSKTLENEQVDCLGIFSVDEALELRKNGIKSRIIMFGIPHKNDFDSIASNEIAVIVASANELQQLHDWISISKKHMKVHLKIDTGMGRLGIFPKEVFTIVEKIFNDYPFIELEGICTHFAESSSPDRSYTLQQGMIFNSLIEELAHKNINPPMIHAANSGGIIHFPEFHFNAVRPGILLYGLSPDSTKIEGLQPALSLYSYIGNIKELPVGSYISYGRTYQTQKPSKIAIIPLGYADGIPLLLSNKGKVLIRDQFFPIVGSVCMNQFMVDITENGDIQTGDQVIIIGKDCHKSITVPELAQTASTITYDVICRLTGFTHRRFI